MLDSRFSERDLVMRYHWGLGVGHIYAHDALPSAKVVFPTDQYEDTRLDDDDYVSDSQIEKPRPGEDQVRGSDACYELDNPELSLDDRHCELEGWEDASEHYSSGYDNMYINESDVSD